MSAQRTQQILDQLGGIRRSIDGMRAAWEADRDDAVVVRGLDALATSSGNPSIEALLFGAARLIEGGEPAGHRLEKLSDHVHGYMVGWEDAAQAFAS